MKKFAFAALIGAFAFTQALAQSSPNLYRGQVPTSTQWNSYFAAKQDVLGYTPLNIAGGSLSGKLTTAPSTTTVAGFNVSPGSAPTSPVDGDFWVTSAGIYARVNGITVGPLTGSDQMLYKVDTIAALQALGASSPAIQFANVASYSSSLSAGGGIFGWITGALPCDSVTGGGDGGTTFCASDGSGGYLTTGYWRRLYSGPAAAAWFGADPAATDSTAELQKWLNSGIASLTCDGVFNTDTLTISAPLSIAAAPRGCTLAAKSGIAADHTILSITASNVSLDGVNFDQTNSSGSGLGVAVSSANYVSLSNGAIINPNNIGILISAAANARVENWKISGNTHAGAWGIESVNSRFGIFSNITGIALPNRLLVTETDEYDQLSNIACYNLCVAEVVFLQDTNFTTVNNVTSDGTPTSTGDDEFVIYGNSQHNSVSNVTMYNPYGVGVNLAASAAGAPAYNVLTNITVTNPGETCLAFYAQGYATAPSFNQVTNLNCYSPGQKVADTFSGVEFTGAQNNSVTGKIVADTAARYAIVESDDVSASSAGNSFSGYILSGNTGYSLWSSSTSRMDLPTVRQAINHYASDADLSWNAGASAYTTIFEGALTADRTITLSATNAAAGACATVLNQSSGGFNVIVSNKGATTLSTLAANAGGSYQFDASNWNVVPSCH